MRIVEGFWGKKKTDCVESGHDGQELVLGA